MSLALVRAEALPRPGDQRWTLLTKALARYRALDILPSWVFDALEASWKAQAGSLAGVWNDSFIRDLYATLQDALVNGISPRDWLPEASKTIKAYGGATNLGIYGPDLTGDSFSAWYASVVFHQNTMNALNAGRYAEMFLGPSLESDPFWLFATAEDERVCPICGPLDGMVFSKIDAEGRRWLPGLHFGCRCTAIDLSPDAVRAGGYKVTPGSSITSPRPADGFDIDGLDLIPEELRRAA
jgi:SPP1 gp7 family putative phage head morphogenesis protein